MSSLVLIASGMGGAMAACLLLRFVWAAIAGQTQLGVWRTSSATNELLYVTTHAAIGAGVGLLFWLSWGFTAMSDWTWWQQGMSFGLLNAAVFGLLPLLIVRSLLNCSSTLYWLLASEILLTCVAAALTSSWSWKQAF